MCAMILFCPQKYAAFSNNKHIKYIFFFKLMQSFECRELYSGRQLDHFELQQIADERYLTTHIFRFGCSLSTPFISTKHFPIEKAASAIQFASHLRQIHFCSA